MSRGDGQRAPKLFPGIPFLLGGFQTSTERKLLYHFISETSRVLTLCMSDKSQDNPVSTLVLPYTLQDTMIQKSVLSLAALHVIDLFPR